MNKAAAQILASAVVASTLAGAAGATEGGTTNYPNGAESFLIAPPPPGDYAVLYANHFSADRFNDGHGNKLFPNFGVEAYAIIPRYVHVSDVTIAGQRLGFAVLVPLVEEQVTVPGRRPQTRVGIGNLDLTAFATTTLAPYWNIAYGTDLFFDTGQYERRALANASPGYNTYQGVFVSTYSQPDGPEVNFKLMYDFNIKNHATGYQSGQAAHADFTLGWNFGHLTAGLGGFAYQQTTDDSVAGRRVGSDGFRGRTIALGPSLKYNFDPLQIWFHYEREFDVRNRPQGNDFWLKTVIRF